MTTLRGIIVFSMLAFLSLTLLMKADWIAQTIDRERRANHDYLGEAHASRAFADATALFEAWFVQTGIQRTSFEVFVPTQAQVDASGAMSDLATPLWQWTANRIAVFWTLVYQVFVRSYTALQWWPFMVFVMVPFLIDGLLTRRINSYTFSLTSTHLHGIAVKSTLTVIIAYAVLMFLPLFVHPSWFPGIILMTAAALWFAIVHFAKRA